MSAAVKKESEVDLNPDDGISSVVFAPTSNNLLVSSWDETLRLYDGTERRQLTKFKHTGPILDTCFLGENLGCAGGIDGTIVSWDFSRNGPGALVGRHDTGVKCVEHAQQTGALLSGGWDRQLRVWDVRAPACQGAHEQPGKVFSMTVTSTRVIVGTSGRHVYIYDMRNLAEPEQRRESSLQHQTRTIRAFPDGTGYALASVEGRVAVEVIDPSPEAQKKKFAFKCHRSSVGGVDYVHPVNALAFHPEFGTLASGGGDCFVNIWDPMNRKRLCQFHRYPAGISALDFSSDGSLLCIASSYSYEEGEKDHPPDKVIIRAVTEADVKPKPRK